jgi:catechol 2,3-dioxygenase-like lactoylglutathione lyase family enzyme
VSNTQVRSETVIETPRARRVYMKLEVVVIPVSDVDRAKRFYGGLGWRLDADFAAGDDWRVIQFTLPGSECSVIFGKNVTAAAPGSAQELYLIVSDIKGRPRRAAPSRHRDQRGVPRRRRTPLDEWLMVALCALLIEVTLASILSGDRYTFSWYAGRFYQLVTGTVVMIILLVEMTTLYMDVARSNTLLQHERLLLERAVQAQRRERDS